MSIENNYPNYNQFGNEYQSNNCFKNICFLIWHMWNLSYLITGIIFLVNEYHITNECHSLMWTYVLIAVCVTVFQIIYNIHKSNKHALIITFIFGGFYLGLGLWGKSIFENVSCTALLNSKLYTWTNISFIFNLIIGPILLTVFLIVCCIRNL